MPVRRGGGRNGLALQSDDGPGWKHLMISIVSGMDPGLSWQRMHSAPNPPSSSRTAEGRSGIHAGDGDNPGSALTCCPLPTACCRLPIRYSLFASLLPPLTTLFEIRPAKLTLATGALACSRPPANRICCGRVSLVSGNKGPAAKASGPPPFYPLPCLFRDRPHWISWQYSHPPARPARQSPGALAGRQR